VNADALGLHVHHDTRAGIRHVQRACLRSKWVTCSTAARPVPPRVDGSVGYIYPTRNLHDCTPANRSGFCSHASTDSLSPSTCPSAHVLSVLGVGRARSSTVRLPASGVGSASRVRASPATTSGTHRGVEVTPEWSQSRPGQVQHSPTVTVPPCLNPLLTPAPIPSAVDPHTVERAWFMASRWSAPLYERPGRHGPRLLGFAWVDGGRDGSPPRSPRCARGLERRPFPPGAGRSPAGGIVLDRGPKSSGARLMTSGPIHCGRASAQSGRSGPEAGAAPRAEPGARPAERSAAGCLMR
jgi:hypothetical protein